MQESQKESGLSLQKDGLQFKGSFMFILFKHCFVQEANSTKPIRHRNYLLFEYLLDFIIYLVHRDKQTIHSGFCISMTGLCKNFSQFQFSCQATGLPGGRPGVLVAGLLLWGLWSAVARASQLHGGHSAGCEAVLGAGGLGPHPWLVLGFPGTPALGCGSSDQLPSPPAGVDAHVSLGCVASGFQCFYGVVDAGASKGCCYDLESSCLFLLFLSNQHKKHQLMQVRSQKRYKSGVILVIASQDADALYYIYWVNIFIDILVFIVSLQSSFSKSKSN